MLAKLAVRVILADMSRTRKISPSGSGSPLGVRRRIKLRKLEKMRNPAVRIDLAGSKPVEHEVRFGFVTISNVQPDASTVKKNVQAGREALGRARAAFTTRGIKLPVKGGVPRFRVDPHDSKILIREIDGLVERGHIVNGTFVAVD